jgi:hypothetical protein
LVGDIVVDGDIVVVGVIVVVGDIAPDGDTAPDGDSEGVVVVSDEPQALKGRIAAPAIRTPTKSLAFINTHQNDIENRFSSDRPTSVNLFLEINDRKDPVTIFNSGHHSGYHWVLRQDILDVMTANVEAV